MSDNTEKGGGNGDTTKTHPLHPILTKTTSVGGSDDQFFRLGPMRPRANTDPSAPRPRLKVRFDLPDIIVDDCSDDELEKLCTPDGARYEQADTEEGAFFVFKSPPRQRANTLPSNMFRRRVKDRPPTPPPSDNVPREGFHRHVSKEMASFSPHKLTKVTEDVPDTQKASERKGTQHKSSSPSRSLKNTHIPGSSSPDVRSRNALKTTRNTVDSPSSSPKRAGAKGVHSHRTTAGSSVRDVIHSTA